MAYLTSGKNKIMGGSVSTDANVVTVIDENSTDEQVPSALATKTYVDNKEVKISTEENNKIEMKDDGIFVSKDYVEITQAEYDLLTEEEKEGIVFYIKDARGTRELATVIDENSTDDEIPSAKAVHTAIQNVSGGVTADVYSKTEVDDLLADKADSSAIVDAYTKTEVDGLLTTKADTTALEQLEDALTDYPTLEYMEEVKTELQTEIANIPKVTKTSDLTNDSGFITASDIPTTLPASDVYAWAKQETKPSYTASEVGALASNGTAVNASKVNNALTLQIAGTTKNTFNGSSAQTFNIPNASTSTAGVMTADMVTKLNGIATGATKNTIDTAMSSTSTNAVQNKVIYAYIQNQLKNAGDYVGKIMISVPETSIGTASGYTYTNSKGGFADLMLYSKYASYTNEFSLIVDGTTIVTNGAVGDILKQIGNSDNNFELKIPFTSTFTVKLGTGNDNNNNTIQGFIYVNK